MIGQYVGNGWFFKYTVLTVGSAQWTPWALATCHKRPAQHWTYHWPTIFNMGGFLWTILKRRLQKTLFSMQAPRLIVQVSLLIAFLHFFGIPAIARFAKKGVVVVETARDTDGIPIPAITLAAFGQITDDACFHKNASIEDCFEKNTLNRSDILKSVILGYRRQQKINLTQELQVGLEDTSLWTCHWRLDQMIGRHKFYLAWIQTWPASFLFMIQNILCSMSIPSPCQVQCEELQQKCHFWYPQIG